jgi:hypothetical protein
MKSFLFANVPLSVVHFICFLVFNGAKFLGQPGYAIVDAVGASSKGFAWWLIMVINSLLWGAVLSLFVFPLIRKILK